MWRENLPTNPALHGWVKVQSPRYSTFDPQNSPDFRPAVPADTRCCCYPELSCPAAALRWLAAAAAVVAAVAVVCRPDQPPLHPSDDPLLPSSPRFVDFVPPQTCRSRRSCRPLRSCRPPPTLTGLSHSLTFASQSRAFPPPEPCRPSPLFSTDPLLAPSFRI